MCMRKRVSLCAMCMLMTLSCLLMSGCHRKRSYFPSHLPMVDVHITRFDSALVNIPMDSLEQQVGRLYADYPEFMPFFVSRVLGIPIQDTAYLIQQLPLFLSDTVYGFAATNRYEQQVYADVSGLERDLGRAFARMQFLFSDIPVPEVLFFVSGFNASVVFTEEGVAVGADMYLGSDYPYYNRVVHNYQKQTMRKESICGDVVSAWLFRHIAFSGTHRRLLEQMIYRGKVMYLLAQLLREQPAYEVMGYTREQWAWCEHYERAIWNKMMDRHDLFSSEQRIIASYLNDGPFTSEISQESPGRLGTWVGWRIVESYMEHQPQVTMQQLMQQSDAQLILQESYYKP